mgnify:CR=1 FL=1
MALLVYPDGTTEDLTLPEEDRLEVMQEAVGGYIEAVYLDADGLNAGSKYTVALVNEDGLMMGLDPNIVASQAMGQPVVGPVLFLNEEEWD